MTLTTRQLLHRLYFDRAYTEVARIIGYEGIELSAFWEQAKALGIPNGKLLNAVYDLTRGDKQEEQPPRYELWDDVKKCCGMLLGPPPGHPLYDELHRQEEPGAEAEPTKRMRKRRERGR